MRALFHPSRACGSVSAPPSKSMAHRALLAAAFAPGESRIRNVSFSRDLEATLRCLSSLGVSFSREGDSVLVAGRRFPQPDGSVLSCGESGSTLRFFLPLCLLCGEPVTLSGSERLLERPLTVYEELCREKGLGFDKGKDSVTVKGPLPEGEYRVRGDISSQFITGLLFALALMPGSSRLSVTGPLESSGYVDLTLEILREFGRRVHREENCFWVEPGAFMPREYTVEGDWSNAAFLEGFRLLGDEVSVTGLREDSLQGDRVYRPYMEAIRSGFAHLDLGQCPDLAPVLFALAALHHGGRFTGCRRLRIKESDRGAAMAEELRKCGCRVELEEDTVTVYGGLHKPEAPIEAHNDHRIAMAMSLILSRFGGELRGAEAVAKSDPDYFDRIRHLGIRVSLRED